MAFNTYIEKINALNTLNLEYMKYNYIFKIRVEEKTPICNNPTSNLISKVPANNKINKDTLSIANILSKGIEAGLTTPTNLL